MTTETDAQATAQLYDRWARAYAAFVRRLPVVGRARDRAVTAMDLHAGDRVVDMGCGPGVNLGRLQRAVGPSGTVIGLDASERMLQLTRRDGPARVDLVRADARRPPLATPVDGVLATFVVTIFEDPDHVVSTWWDHLAPGGRLALLNLAPVRGPLGPPLNLALTVSLAVSTPGSREDRLIDLLDRRLNAAHAALVERADRVHYRDDLWGGLRLAVGEKASGPG